MNQTPLKAIRAKCLDCSVYQPKEVKNCTCTDCSLYPYRFGNNPRRKGIGCNNKVKRAKSDKVVNIDDSS